jgi:membrane protease YdiL (CAAX protease family)
MMTTKFTLFSNLFLGWITFSFVLGLSPILVDQLSILYPMNEPIQQMIQGVVVTSITLPIILILCKKVIHIPLSQLGLVSFRYGWLFFLLGIGSFICFLLFSLWLSQQFGWSNIISIQASSPLLWMMLINIPAAFLYEAFPEELVFRGYLFYNLNQAFRRWLAVLIQVGLFVLAPLSITIILPVFGLKAGLDFTVDYVITLIIFGIVLQLCRIVSRNLWMNIGFHLTFLMNSRFLVSDKSHSFIQVQFIHELSIVLIYLGPCIFMITVLFVIHKMKKRNG